MNSGLKKKLVPAAVVLAFDGVGFFGWTNSRPSGLALVAIGAVLFTLSLGRFRESIGTTA
jgi:hypothetical protein